MSSPPIGRPIFSLLAAIRRHRSASTTRILDRRTGDTSTAAIADVTRAMVDTDDPRAALCHAAQRVTAAEHASLLEVGGDPPLLQLRAVAGLRLDIRAVAVDAPASITAEAYRTGHSIFVPDVRRDPRADQGPLHHAGMVSALAHPVRRADRTLGVLALAWRRRVRLRAEQTALVELLAASSALAIERSALLVQAQEAAHTDSLTAIANRRLWELTLPREIARAARQGTAVTIALLDLDHFKAYNDVHGHQAGDELLREAAERWDATLRKSDLLARYGGEEFGVLLPDTAAAEAWIVLERVRAMTPAGMTCSAGLATWDGEEAPDALVARADRALYAAKASGRNATFGDSAETRARLLDHVRRRREPG